MKINDIPAGTTIQFVGCGECTGKHVCFFCVKGVKTKGVVVFTYPDFDIPTVEVEVEGTDALLELTLDDIEDPELVSSVEI